MTCTVVFVLLLAAYAVLTRVDFLGDMVLRQVEKIVREQLQAEISVSQLSGNPITGFRADTLVVSRSGDALLSVESAAVNISIPSLLTGSPRVGQLTLNGLRSDYDSLLALTPPQKEGGGPTDIPINKAVINKSRLDTPWGLIELDKSVLYPKNTEWFDLDLSGAFASAPVTVRGGVRKKNGGWALEGMKLGLAGGSAVLSGQAFPSPDLSLDLKNVELEEVAKLVPGLRKTKIRGAVTGTMELKGTGDELAISGDGTLRNALIAGIPLAEVNAGWTYSKDLIDLKINKGDVFKSSIVGNFRLDSRSGVPTLSLAANINNLNFNDWTNKITGGAKISQTLSGTGTTEIKHIRGVVTALDASLEGPLDALTGHVSLAPSDIGYKTLQITGIAGQAVFSGKPSGEVSFSAFYKNEKMTLDGSLSFAKNVASDLKFKAGSLALGDIVSVIDGLEGFKPSGQVGISASLSGVFGEWVARGDVASPRISEDRYGVFRNVKLAPRYNFKDDSLTLAQSSVEWNGARVTISGALDAGSPQTLDFGGTFSDAVTANFEILLPFFKTLGADAALSGKWNLGGTLASPVVTADISASDAKLRGVGIDRFYGRLRYVPGKLTLEPMDFRIGNGGANLAAEAFFPLDADGKYLPVVWKVTGTLTKIPGSALNKAFNLDEPFDGYVSGPIEAGNAGGEMAWSFDAHGQNVSWREFRADEAKGKIYGGQSAVEVENMRVSFLRGEHVINGRITLAEAGRPMTDSALDLTVDIKKLNVYELLRKHIPQVRGFQGLIEGQAIVTGTVGIPLISGNGTISPLRFRSFLLPRVDVSFGGSLRDISGDATARLRQGDLKANARVWLEEGEWHAGASVDGTKINLNQIGRYLPEGFREKLAGNADFTLKGGGRAGDFSGEGMFKSGGMKIWNVEITDLQAPFYIFDGYAIVEDVKARSNGGEVTGGVAFDLGKNRWGGNLTVMGADISAFLSQSVPQLPGSISGKGDFKIRAGGETGRMSSVRAAGAMQLHGGALSGFSAVEAAHKFTKGNPLRFETVQANFNYAGGFLTILPGSQAIAPKNDPVYRYMMLDGTIDENGVLGLFAMGKANIQALNALLGALQGLMDLGINFNEPLDKAELLQGLIGGALTGFSRSDFRFVTMGIRGTYDAPRFENIRVQGSSRSASEAIPRTPSDPKDDAFSSGNKTFKFRFEIPVGPGASPGDRLDEQARGQILKNALDSLLKNADF